jgi:CLIP-associating protein 1/2
VPRNADHSLSHCLYPVQSLGNTNVTIRQAAHTLILAVQCVFQDVQATLALFPEMDKGQQNLACYLFEKNGLTRKAMTPGLVDTGGRNRVVDEMGKLMARGGR